MAVTKQFGDYKFVHCNTLVILSYIFSIILIATMNKELLKLPSTVQGYTHVWLKINSFIVQGYTHIWLKINSFIVQGYTHLWLKINSFIVLGYTHLWLKINSSIVLGYTHLWKYLEIISSIFFKYQVKICLQNKKMKFITEML